MQNYSFRLIRGVAVLKGGKIQDSLQLETQTANTMVEIASITALIQKCRTVVKYLKDVQEAPNECNELRRELRHMEIHLSTIKIITSLSAAGDPWLMILQQLNDPFRELTGLLVGIEKGLKATTSWWKKAGPRSQWTISEQSAKKDLMKIEDIGSLIMHVVEQHECLYKKAKEVADWLTPVDHSAIQRDKLEQRVGDTGWWFLSRRCFRVGWKLMNFQAGTGKTILASIAIDYLRRRFAKENIPVLCVFGDWQNAGARTALSIIRSLLKQLLNAKNGLSSSLENRIQYQTLNEFTELLRTHLKRYHHAYIVFDALDEFPGDRKELVSVLKSLGDSVHLMVTSRSNARMERLFQDDEELRIRADDDDIRKLILNKLNHEESLCVSLTDRGDLRQSILTRIVEGANGMFFLADMHMTLLAQTKDRDELIEALNKLPDTIEGTYEHFLERVDYSTAREYLISQKDRLFPGVQEHITCTCLTYMSFDVFHSPNVLPLPKPEISAKYPFLNYASSNWAIHARKCARGSVEEDILAFLPTQARIALSFEQPPDLEPEVPRTPAWFAAKYGLLNLLEALVERGVDLQRENVLCIAAHGGQLDTVKLLLSRDDVDVNQASKITYLYDYSIDRNDGANRLGFEDGRASRPTFCTPLIAAASNGYEEIVRVLLESEDMKSMNLLPPSGPTALSVAVFGNHTGVVKLLLSQPGIDTSIRFLDETPLMLSKRKCRDNIVKIFIDRGNGDDGLRCSTSD
ncbi:uncharacterized protein EV420DRAFT_1486820 [Desarmillaria tabescens]|uniref:Nephrocystin 3-like N-terminal domain-containing protein n=1 Tax=Armillaria tabescens TaxID=1929756 RepID=A0AA39MKF6_ARMTA|nr:uncharacterized protein EV420DRAFT_1486820 [Desarmillaria tabescens]KAK0438166.1 hypothetical protein EV420DRAFT_1486820 [Desarmillaria tabescens]